MLLKQFLRDEFRFLTFRAPSAAVREHAGAYLAFGLFVTWLAGVGRYWDSPYALPWQHFGLSSLVYVFLLALVVWAVVLPLGPRNWSYRNVLLFLTFTAAPALLYAMPVELFLPYSIAHAVNSAFLATVASWRVALLFVFLKRVAGLGGFTIVVAAVLPLAVVVDGIAVVGLEHIVYQNMIGAHGADGQADGDGRNVARFVCLLAAGVTPALVVSYGWMVYKARASGRPAAS